MKRFIVLLISMAVLVTFSGDVMAVSKKTKKDTTKTKVIKQEKPKVKKPAASKTAKKVTNEKKYDNFIDKNNNGIDDRKEKLVPKATTQDKTKKTKKTKKKK